MLCDIGHSGCFLRIRSSISYRKVLKGYRERQKVRAVRGSTGLAASPGRFAVSYTFDASLHSPAVLLCRDWAEELKQEADLKLARQSDRQASGMPGSLQPKSYSVHLVPGSIEVHPVQYSALR